MIRGIITNYSGYEINSLLDTDFKLLQKIFFDETADTPTSAKVMPLDEFINSI